MVGKRNNKKGNSSPFFVKRLNEIKKKLKSSDISDIDNIIDQFEFNELDNTVTLGGFKIVNDDLLIKIVILSNNVYDNSEMLSLIKNL